MLDHVHKPFAMIFAPGHPQRANRRLQAGQWILDLVADIGGELFIGVDAVIKCGHHATHRNRQTTNFIGSRRKIGNAHAARRHFARITVATKLCGGRKIGKRIGNG